MADARVPLHGSEETLRSGERVEAAVAADRQLAVTIMLRRAAQAPSADDLLSGRYQFKSRQSAEDSLQADPNDMRTVADYARAEGLTIAREDAAGRRLDVSGTAAQMSSAFGVELQSIADASGHRFLSYRGSIQLPSSVAPLVVAVLGLSQRTAAQHH